MLSRDEMFPTSEGLEGESTPSRASSSDECQMSVVRDAICNEIAAAHGNASPSDFHTQVKRRPRMEMTGADSTTRHAYVRWSYISDDGRSRNRHRMTRRS
ncbi:hypothetical protein QJS10_CPB22g00658 [Acorus calamus]|uniref:Uncharacterized protein n=1 Tax=Acorus calamus TaxID=4465 RepID=A0AAV9C382_ACOCL|nr:hypothetical protein QJS10_CPB22g00658 [Acorus calamus]